MKKDATDKVKPSILEAIVVEGRYDVNAVSQVVDTLVVETKGFGIFKDKEQLCFLRQLAKHRGLIVLTDSDGAGFVIRQKLQGTIPKNQLKHGYIPDIYGKEKRKNQKSKEGKLGVEGMSATLLWEAILQSGATLSGDTAPPPERSLITSADFLFWGLTGEGSGQRRQDFLAHLNLPSRMSKKGLLAVLNHCYGKEKVEEILENWDK